MSMKRKIAAILAADVVGYSRLIAEDEEETLRRLASYREVIDEFIAKAHGRIFNTAGDAVLAEFPSAVEAVRCAIDIQESLRTRNMAYPPSRQMSLRIGITIGDVVERDGDLLGDGVNIAARLEGLAAPGGICISRTVYEQVANKLSVQFADIGAQDVKNIPNPVHAYMVALRAEDVQADAARRRKKGRVPLLAAAAAAVVVIAAAVAGGVYYNKVRSTKTPVAATAPVTPSPAVAPTPATPPQQATATPPPAQPQVEPLVPGTIPFISDLLRAQVRDEYMSAPDIKALALAPSRFIGYVTGQPNEELAKNAALETCQKRVEAAKLTAKCELYAVGNKVVYARPRPAMPPTPYVTRDPLVERPFVADEIPMVREATRNNARNYVTARKFKALAMNSSGAIWSFFGIESSEEAVRRVLELCGSSTGTPCMVVAVDDTFVVQVPRTMKSTGFFRPATSPNIASNEREFLARRYANPPKGWSAVAASLNSGKSGAAFGAESEEAAVKAALAECAKVDRECRVIAIGPFNVEPL